MEEHIYDRIDRLKKVELHCHLDGSIRPETMYEILQDEGIIEGIAYDEYKKMVVVEEDNDSLVEYLKKFDYPGKASQKEKYLERIAYELVEDLAEDNVIYAEIRFAPYLHMRRGLLFDEVVGAVLEGVRRGEKDFGVITRIILIAMRDENMANSISIVNQGKKYLNKGVVGFDIAGNESDFPPEIHEDSFNIAKDFGYALTVHAGETGIAENIKISIQLLRTDRIGHGIAAIEDEDIVGLIRDKGIYLEMCPISNLHTKAVDDISEYPIKKFMDAGIKVTVNTDNRTVSETNLSKEYKLLVDKLGFTMEDIIKTIENAIDGSFIDEEVKDELRDKLRDSYE